MSKGCKIKAIFPPEWAYGENNNGIIAANSTLIFDIELIDYT